MKGTILNSENTSTFETDLNEAHEYENRLGHWFTENFNCDFATSSSYGSFPDWDVSVFFHDYKKTITFEVKQDKKVAETGKVCVEFSRTLKNGTVKPTCISISKADVYAYHFNGTYYLIDTEDLRTMIEAELYSDIKHGAGEGDRASVYLFKKEVFLKYAKNIKSYL